MVKNAAPPAKIAKALATPTDLSRDGVEICEELPSCWPTFSLYLKTKNFHWHMSGPHFRDYHLMLDEQSEQIFAMTDRIAERVRKIGGMTLHSIGEISRKQRIKDNDAEYVTPLDMLAELREDNQQMTRRCAQRTKSATVTATSPRPACWKDWIDFQTERATWFLSKTVNAWPTSKSTFAAARLRCRRLPCAGIGSQRRPAVTAGSLFMTGALACLRLAARDRAVDWVASPIGGVDGSGLPVSDAPA